MKTAMTAGLVFIMAMGYFGGARAETPGDRGKLDVCIYLYENGEYSKAVDSLRALLPRLSDKSLQGDAYKYLAFSYVMLDMINTAKANFDSLLLKFPNLEIDTIAVPPNITVVFKQAKLESELKKQQEQQVELRKQVGRESPAYWITGAALAGAAGLTGLLFTLRGMDQFNQYDAIADTSRIEDLRTFRNQSEFSYLVSYIAYGAAGAASLFGGYKFYRWYNNRPSDKAALFLDGRGAVFVYRF